MNARECDPVTGAAEAAVQTDRILLAEASRSALGYWSSAVDLIRDAAATMLVGFRRAPCRR